MEILRVPSGMGVGQVAQKGRTSVPKRDKSQEGTLHVSLQTHVNFGSWPPKIGFNFLIFSKLGI